MQRIYIKKGNKMPYYRVWGHTVYDCRYHLVWITKYRKRWIHPKLQPMLEWILRDIREEMFVKILNVGFEEDHVHMYLSVPLATGHIPEVVQKLKWTSSKILWEKKELEEYFKKFYRKEWVGKRARWYFICTVWEINDQLVMKYIDEQWQIPAL